MAGKTPKKTTFSLNQTTWADSITARSQTETDSDAASESSENVADRNVKILLEEKRKVCVVRRIILSELVSTSITWCIVCHSLYSCACGKNFFLVHDSEEAPYSNCLHRI